MRLDLAAPHDFSRSCPPMPRRSRSRSISCRKIPIKEPDLIPDIFPQQCKYPKRIGSRARLKPSLLWRAVAEEFRLA